jgi:hypothetical protein
MRPCEVNHAAGSRDHRGRPAFPLDCFVRPYLIQGLAIQGRRADVVREYYARLRTEATGAQGNQLKNGLGEPNSRHEQSAVSGTAGQTQIPPVLAPPVFTERHGTKSSAWVRQCVVVIPRVFFLDFSFYLVDLATSSRHVHRKWSI